MPDIKDPFDQRAKEILRANDRGSYNVPRPGLYPFQWNWDSAFVALGFAQFDKDRAWQELETLFSGQWANGMVPHIIFHQNDPSYFPGPDVWRSGTIPPTSGITQPPVAASIVRDLWAAEGSDPAHPRMRALFPKLVASHRWFHTHRDPLRNGTVMTVHNWETGRDNNAEWDHALTRVDTSHVKPYQRRDTAHIDASMRPTQNEYDRYVALLEFGRERKWDAAKIAAESPFRIVDVGMSMMLTRANRDLLELANAMGNRDIGEEIEARLALSEAGCDFLWNEELGVHCSVDLIDGASTHLVTSASFLGLYAGVGNPRQRRQLIARLEALASEVTYMVPSLAPGSRTYDPVRYWRGPVWLVVNYMLARGLSEAGESALASRLKSDSAALVRKHGFYEYFSPETGQGCGGDEFSWTAAMWLHQALAMS